MKTYEFSTNVTHDGRLIIPDAYANEIKSSTQNPANIQPASGLLAEHLSNSPEIPDPSFDVATWNQEWDEIETEMKMLEIAEQKSERMGAPQARF